MPLKQLSKFIDDNKHLPNIPAASEIESSGLAVGDISRRMMEKIEELTLYIIAQDQRLSKLESDNALLTDQMNELNDQLAKLPEKERKRYTKEFEKQLRKDFEKQIENLSINQGKIFIKLIDRETGHTSFELIKELKLQYNKARQAAITNEILEIVAGAEALNG